MLPNQRHLFDIPPDVAYLNCAYMSPMLKAAVATGSAALARKAAPWTIRAEDFFSGPAAARERFGRLLGARAEQVALVPSASYGMAVATRNLPLAHGQRAILLEESFPSFAYPWGTAARDAGAEVVWIPRPADDDWTTPVLAAIDDRTALAALPHCHWTDGALLDLPAIRRRLNEVGGALVVDATQSLGALPFPLADADPDFLVAACYKWLLGPYSTGFLYVAERHLGGRPVEEGWISREGSEDFSGLVRYRDGYQPGARRFDAGESANFALLPAVIASLDQLLAWGVEEIQATLAARTTAVAEQAAGLGLNSVPRALRAGHYLGLRVPGGVPAGLPERFAEQQVYVSVRGSAIRVTPHLWTTDEDVERFFAVLEGVGT